MSKTKPLHWHVLAVFAFGLSLPAASAWADGETTPTEGTLIVDVSSVPNDKGQVGCSLFSKKDGFPMDPEKADMSLFVTQKAGKATCTFKNVKPGKYAVSVMHDEDKDGELNTSIVGRPKEWWGVSNNVPAERFGPPKYEAAAFDYSGASKMIKVKLTL